MTQKIELAKRELSQASMRPRLIAVDDLAGATWEKSISEASMRPRPIAVDDV